MRNIHKEEISFQKREEETNEEFCKRLALNIDPVQVLASIFKHWSRHSIVSPEAELMMVGDFHHGKGVTRAFIELIKETTK